MPSTPTAPRASPAGGDGERLRMDDVSSRGHGAARTFEYSQASGRRLRTRISPERTRKPRSGLVCRLIRGTGFVHAAERWTYSRLLRQVVWLTPLDGLRSTIFG